MQPGDRLEILMERTDVEYGPNGMTVRVGFIGGEGWDTVPGSTRGNFTFFVGVSPLTTEIYNYITSRARAWLEIVEPGGFNQTFGVRLKMARDAVDFINVDSIEVTHEQWPMLMDTVLGPRFMQEQYFPGLNADNTLQPARRRRESPQERVVRFGERYSVGPRRLETLLALEEQREAAMTEARATDRVDEDEQALEELGLGQEETEALNNLSVTDINSETVQNAVRSLLGRYMGVDLASAAGDISMVHDSVLVTFDSVPQPEPEKPPVDNRRKIFLDD